MAFYLQYDDSGNITATVLTDGPAPECANQIALDRWTDTAGMMVDTVTRALVPAPEDA